MITDSIAAEIPAISSSVSELDEVDDEDDELLISLPKMACSSSLVDDDGDSGKSTEFIVCCSNFGMGVC